MKVNIYVNSTKRTSCTLQANIELHYNLLLSPIFYCFYLYDHRVINTVILVEIGTHENILLYEFIEVTFIYDIHVVKF